jgi:hypothetical protein
MKKGEGAMCKELKCMSNEELLKVYETYYDTIYGANPVYGTKDVMYLHEIEREMDKREEGV